MTLKHGLWLTLLDDAGESTPVACDVTEKQPSLWVLEALVPPQVYPVTFVSARLRLDGHFLGFTHLPEPITTVTHEPAEVSIRFPLDAERLEEATRGR